ncbi:Permease of the drug/metabolite transporter (DMT) superfamily [Enterobacter hormaechei]|nr:Permease of the drug/metabolite transporter (DMT) superfamily [Enterobacter hormaechei]VAM37259.1 Permease of the drug/metabolite transporter (DMT) superfamily [Enterobacter hormaechei]
MNALLYGLVVVIWGTTWIAIFLQQGPVAAPVSIFWRFAVASATMMIVLVALRRLRRLALRDHLYCMLQGCCVFCFNFWCFYTAAAHINTGLESVIFSMAVLYNAINSFIFFGQRPPRASGRRQRWGLSGSLPCSGTICSPAAGARHCLRASGFPPSAPTASRWGI